jgi:rubrerythrin
MEMSTLTYQQKIRKKKERKAAIRNMSQNEKKVFNEHRRRSKAGMRPAIPEEDDTDSECIKCGFKTRRDHCPDCGRPVF